MDDEVPPPSTFAFSWLSGLLLYGTPNDDGHAAWDTWVLTHPDLRLSTALAPAWARRPHREGACRGRRDHRARRCGSGSFRD